MQIIKTLLTPLISPWNLQGRYWVHAFLLRHPPLSFRKPEGMSMERSVGFSKVQMDRYFKNLQEIDEKHGFPTKPNRTYNMDESGLFTVPNRIFKIVVTKGHRKVNKVVSGEWGQTVTVVFCMSAAGHFVPSAMIFPRKRMKVEPSDGAPPSSLFFLSDSGYMKSDLFKVWL